MSPNFQCEPQAHTKSPGHSHQEICGPGFEMLAVRKILLRYFVKVDIIYRKYIRNIVCICCRSLRGSVD